MDSILAIHGALILLAVDNHLSTSEKFYMSPLLLTAHDCTGHVQLVVGSNSIASARCIKALEYGAKPIVIAPFDAEVHYALEEKIEAGEVKWIKRNFEDNDVRSLGRDEVDRVVDAVFVTLNRRESSGI